MKEKKLRQKRYLRITSAFASWPKKINLTVLKREQVAADKVLEDCNSLCILRKVFFPFCSTLPEDGLNSIFNIYLIVTKANKDNVGLVYPHLSFWSSLDCSTKKKRIDF